MHATTPTLVTCASAAHVVKSRQTVLLSVALLSLRLQRSDLIFLGPVNRHASRRLFPPGDRSLNYRRPQTPSLQDECQNEEVVYIATSAL
jgi:hypothetical protein